MREYKATNLEKLATQIRFYTIDKFEHTLKLHFVVVNCV